MQGTQSRNPHGLRDFICPPMPLGLAAGFFRCWRDVRSVAGPALWHAGGWQPLGCSAPSRGCRARGCGHGAAASLHSLGRPFLISVCPLRCGESDADVNVLSGGSGRVRSCLSRQCQPNTPPTPLPGSARQTQLSSPARWVAVLATNTSTSVFSFFPTARGGAVVPSL